MEQKENSSTVQNQLEVISSRIENLEKTGMDESETTRKQFEALINGLEELKQLIGEAKGQICNVVSEQTQKCISNVSTAVEKEGKTREQAIAEVKAEHTEFSDEVLNKFCDGTYDVLRDEV